MSEPFDPSRIEAFHHDGWDVDGDEVRLRYLLGPHRFQERFVVPGLGSGLARTGDVEATVSLLHVCAGTSYYKAAAPPEVTGVPSWLAGFAASLYLDGLAEFAMANDRPLVAPDFSTVPALPEIGPLSTDVRGLVAVGGGKDSTVTIESCRSAGRDIVLGSVRTHRAIADTARVSGYRYLVVDRVIDPRLLELNGRGALNGHVPVTAINSTALALLASAHGIGNVVMSNESSASVPITSHGGRPVNHQWSKSLECEATLAGLLPVRYFSLLRPLHEVEICRRFATLTGYFGVVTSCNQAYTAVGRAAGTRWCGTCPKCHFVFLGLAPFLTRAELVGIFDGRDLLDDPANEIGFRSVLGMGGPPPMECVGTARESKWAMARLADSDEWRNCAVVSSLAREVDVVAGWSPLDERGPHGIPTDWIGALDALA
jgi:hypothetical protein